MWWWEVEIGWKDLESIWTEIRTGKSSAFPSEISLNPRKARKVLQVFWSEDLSNPSQTIDEQVVFAYHSQLHHTQLQPAVLYLTKVILFSPQTLIARWSKANRSPVLSKQSAILYFQQISFSISAAFNQVVVERETTHKQTLLLAICASHIQQFPSPVLHPSIKWW